MPEPQSQDTPGAEKELTPQADHGERSYRSCDKLTGRDFLQARARALTTVWV